MNSTNHHFTVDHLSATADPIGSGWHSAVVDLGEGMTAENPASTRDNLIAGPATVTYLFAPSGSVSVEVTRAVTPARVISDREEHESCEAGTPGCCINHNDDPGSCETW